MRIIEVVDFHKISILAQLHLKILLQIYFYLFFLFCEVLLNFSLRSKNVDKLPFLGRIFVFLFEMGHEGYKKLKYCIM